MPAVAREDSVSAQAGRRWRDIDPLLPTPWAMPAGCVTSLAVTGPDGRTAAAGACEHWHPAPDALDLTWGAAGRFQLTPRVAGPDPAAALDRLLAAWRDHLAAVPEAGAEDTAAIVTWPSRDVRGVKSLLRHGLRPMAVIAARTAGRWPGPGGMPAGSAGGTDGVAGPGGVRVRRAGPADADAVVRLGLETIRFDAHFGGVTERPSTPSALGREARTLLAEPEPWIFLAERDGTPAGMVLTERPAAAGWIAPLVGLAPAAYLMLMAVLPGDRGRGVGTALATRMHQEIAAAGVAVTLLHYAQTNPLSAPFWGRQGYRPLWTSWEARPARTLR
jgi:GNAT superfamily N-acetyltransferase